MFLLLFGLIFLFTGNLFDLSELLLINLLIFPSLLFLLDVSCVPMSLKPLHSNLRYVGKAKWDKGYFNETERSLIMDGTEFARRTNPVKCNATSCITLTGLTIMASTKFTPEVTVSMKSIILETLIPTLAYVYTPTTPKIVTQTCTFSPGETGVLEFRPNYFNIAGWYKSVKGSFKPMWLEVKIPIKDHASVLEGNSHCICLSDCRH